MDFAIARRNMVENQVRPNHVTDTRVLDTLAEVPREAFLPKERQGVAYVDEDVPLGNGRYLMEPMILARLVQAAEIKSSDVALVVGCASGYAAAVVAKLAVTVVALESDRTLVRTATETLARLGVDTAAVVEGPLAEGYARQAPYDVILIDGGVEELPRIMLEQLAEGGRLIAVTGPAGRGRGVRMLRTGSSFTRVELFDAGVPILADFAARPKFVF